MSQKFRVLEPLEIKRNLTEGKATYANFVICSNFAGKLEWLDSWSYRKDMSALKLGTIAKLTFETGSLCKNENANNQDN